MLQAIPHDIVEQTWSSVEPLLQKAMKAGQGDYEMEDMKAGLLNRDYQLWVWWFNHEIVAACVTGIIIYPRRKVCSMMLIGGEGLRFWKTSAQAQIIEWAKACGCSALEGYDTRAWLRVLLKHGWRKVWVTIRKEI